MSNAKKNSKAAPKSSPEELAAALQVLISDSAWNRYAYLVEEQDVQVFRVSDKVMESISDTKTPQGVAAVCRLPDMNAPVGSLCVALNAVQDPGKAPSH